jgi:hypothetical protein
VTLCTAKHLHAVLSDISIRTVLIKKGVLTSNIVVIKLITESIEILPHTRYVGICDILLTQELAYQ